FGAAKKEFHQFMGSGTVIYTPGWGAPEQNLGEATPASDLYGVGAVFFFLLTGQDPRASMKQLAGGKTELFRSPHDLVPRVTPEISDRKSTRLNSSHVAISYAVFCLKKKKILLY